MEKKRPSYFSGSWYPDRSDDAATQIRLWESKLAPAEKEIYAGIVPHAGWFFSGEQAYDVIRRISEDIDLLFVLGGHLPAGSPLLFWSCSQCQTPFGFLPVHQLMRARLMEITDSRFDDSPDNTIEIQLPFIRYSLGDIPVVPLRVPADTTSISLIEKIMTLSRTLNVKIAIIGSTDLTHYGPDYLFTPPGSQENPAEWVRKSDKKILTAMEQMKAREVLNLADLDHSACSAGAAAAVVSFAEASNAKKGIILDYKTSLEKHKGESFVGYGSLIYAS